MDTKSLIKLQKKTLVLGEFIIICSSSHFSAHVEPFWHLQGKKVLMQHIILNNGILKLFGITFKRGVYFIVYALESIWSNGQ